MISINSLTSYNIVDILNKPLYFIESDQLNVCNLISPDDLGFFQEYYRDYYTEIVYYEYERPICTFAQNVEKHISQVWKISSKDTLIIHVQFLKNH
ncbi:hypothetical protein [uncultured Methanobrevibacter sp.]|uniref:hypothetical protein n=1 Tax=uncultured Methanobrevibacter sp. TaxID=253161 RepID=UPI0025E675D2|nr:hypothetical protein [uncultured Methanobrevibacter sp.]